jgi:peptidoglycan hydrolase CwlO-like protein
MKNNLENFASKVTKWIGSIWSIIIHTLIFVLFFILIYLGFNPERVMLILTTLVSLEAIYLALFIQMTVNKHSEHIADIAEDVDEIQEDIDDIAEDVDEIQEDIDDIQEDIEELNEDEDENETVNLKN